MAGRMIFAVLILIAVCFSAAAPAFANGQSATAQADTARTQETLTTILTLVSDVQLDADKAVVTVGPAGDTHPVTVEYGSLAKSDTVRGLMLLMGGLFVLELFGRASRSVRAITGTPRRRR